MNILNNYTTINSAFLNKESTKLPEQRKHNYDVLDILTDKLAKKSDVKDTVTMPRAIFKGYLCFTAGTALNAIAGMLKKPKVTKGLGIAGSLISIYGTYNFVKPFLVRNVEDNNDLTKNEK